jgi:hypothetical protein
MILYRVTFFLRVGISGSEALDTDVTHMHINYLPTLRPLGLVKAEC